MKLQKFRKNRKQKGIAIGCVIVLLLTIAGVNLYRTFALYKEEKTFNVLRGVVPDFSKYRETPYNEQLNGADPVLDKNGTLIPVIVDPDTGVVTKADPEKEWYNYEKKQWANAIIPTTDAKDVVVKLSTGQIINESQIESYFVWIPKYSYQIQTIGTSSSSKSTAFDIKFGTENTDDSNDHECTTPVAATASGENGNCVVGDYMTHPAFLAFGGKGLWVGKFETGYKDATSSLNAQNDTTAPQKVVIKPNEYSWRSLTLANAYKNSLNYKTTLKSHMMKNTEWGAVAYLNQSIYGRCTSSTSCTEVGRNNNSFYVTGYSGYRNTVPDRTGVKPGSSNGYTIGYPKGDSAKASTTGNNTGIYDMSGGVREYVMGVVYKTGNKIPNYGESGFSASNFPKESEYYDVYKYGTTYDDAAAYSRGILGDATRETKFFSSETYIAYSDYPWFARGGYYNDSTAGWYVSIGSKGGASTWCGFRIVLAVELAT